jgi:ribosomal protein S6E (S10)
MFLLDRRTLYDKRISQEVNGEDLGDEFAGYVSGSKHCLGRCI